MTVTMAPPRIFYAMERINKSTSSVHVWSATSFSTDKEECDRQVAAANHAYIGVNTYRRLTLVELPGDPDEPDST